MSANARITISLIDLRGVKKMGLLRGLSLRWRPSQDDANVMEKEEKFMWVGDRDELFARLIGQDGRRWLKA
jgi:GRAM domain-containing protein 4